MATKTDTVGTGGGGDTGRGLLLLIALMTLLGVVGMVLISG